MRSLPALAALTAAVVLAGCTSDPDPQPAPEPSSTAPSAVPSPSLEFPPPEGPASEPVSWPDGVTATLAAVEQVPAEWGSDVPDGWTIVRVTVEVTNGGTVTIPVEPQTQETQLLYGPNRTEAEAVAGYTYDDPDDRRVLQSEGETQIPAGGGLTIVESAIVPNDTVGDLAVQVMLPAVDGFRDPYLWTEAGALLRKVE